MNTPKKLLMMGAGLAMAGSALGQDLEGAYGAFTQSSLESAAFEAFGEGFDDRNAFTKSLDYFKYGVKLDVDFNDNIYNTGIERVSDTIFRVSVPLEISNERENRHHVGLHYTPKFNSYVDNSGEDGIDHFVNGKYIATLEKTIIDVDAGFAKVKSSDRFATGNIGKKGLTFRTAVVHQLTGKTRLDLDFGVASDDFDRETLFDRERYNTRLAWQYQITGKTTLGPYVAYEYVDIDTQPNHKAFSAGVKSTYQALNKTTFSGYLGWENRKFDGGSVSDQNSPSFELAASHQLTGKTSVFGMLYNATRASYTEASRSYRATGLNLNLNHKMSERIRLNGGVSYEFDDYFATQANTQVNQDTNYSSIFAGGSYAMDNGVTLGSRLKYVNNESDQSSKDYQNWVFTLDAGYNF